jgi:hypothetical protein
MKKIFTIILSISFLIISSHNVISQEKWNNDPRMTSIHALENYVPLPQIKLNYQPALHHPRIIRTPNSVVDVSANFMPHPDAGATQSECPLVGNKQQPNVLFGSANVVWPANGFSGIGEGVYVSTNGGTNWYGFDSTVGGTPYNNHLGDPGPAICYNGNFIISHLGYSISGIYVNYSTNYGVTWSPNVTVIAASVDKNLSSTDDIPSSPYYGRAYTVWSDFAQGLPPIVFSYSTDFGVSWTAPLQINNPPSSNYSQGCDIVTGPAGRIYVTWAAPLAGSPFTEQFDGFASSTNGGANWVVSESAFTANGIRGTLSNKSSIRVNSFVRIACDKSGGSRNGWVYIVGCDKNLSPAGTTPDIILHRTSDGGATWSSGIRVNQDSINLHTHWFPAVCVDDSGAVLVCYYDDRNVGGSLAQIYLSRSTDGGTTWTDVQASDHNFTPAPIPGLGTGYQGDYIGIAATNGKVYPFWCDPSSGFYQVWTCAVTFQTAPPATHDIAVGPFLSLPSSFVINNAYAIKTKVQNLGAQNESGIPVRFYINGTLTNTSNINLNTGQVDSVSNSWTPVSAGIYEIKYISALPTDSVRTNDTVQTTITVQASQPSLCEGFNSSTFPPTGWSTSGSDTYWSLETQSGYGNGTGSAMWDNFDAPEGTTGSLISLTFSPVISIDSLHFALTYCPWSSYPDDSLIIRSSTDAGTTYTLLARLGETQLGTVTGTCTHPFTPAAADWGRRSYVLPIGTNKIQFTAVSGYGDHLYIDSIGLNPCWNYIGIAKHYNEIPKVFSLSQNYPNPFNPTTKIDFAIPKANMVKLVVYNVLGSEVATMVNENMQAGYHSITFNGLNLASGVYFYKITAGDFTAVKKMLLIK